MSESDESETEKKYHTAKDIEITFEDGTVISFGDGDVVGEVKMPELSEDVKKYLSGDGPYEITVSIVPYWNMHWIFPPGGVIPGLHDN